MARVSICKLETASSTRTSSSLELITPHFEIPLNLVNAKFSLIDRCGIRADLRSPGTYEMPNLIASVGWLKVTFSPLIKISPESGLLWPAKISNNKSCPCPSRAATPSTSPFLILKLKSLRCLPPDILFTSINVSALIVDLDNLTSFEFTLFLSPSIA